MIALGWAFSPDEARRMAETGAQFVGAMIGMTAGGSAGGKAITGLDEAIEKVAAMVDAAYAVNKEVLVLGHGGPFNDPASVSLLLKHTSAAGYVTGSTGERIPVEKAVAQAVREFKQVRR